MSERSARNRKAAGHIVARLLELPNIGIPSVSVYCPGYAEIPTIRVTLESARELQMTFAVLCPDDPANSDLYIARSVEHIWRSIVEALRKSTRQDPARGFRTSGDDALDQSTNEDF